MNRVLIYVPLMLVAVFLGGCASRGQFSEACPGTMTPVYWQAKSAIYLDLDGNELDKKENLSGTYLKVMCASEGPSNVPDACPCGTCDKVILGKHYCRACTTNPCP
jgi:hypothetical protein